MGLYKLNEDLKTFAHNAIGSAVHGQHALNLKKIEVLGAADPFKLSTMVIGKLIHSNKLEHDKAYFDSMYSISPKLKAKLLKWVSGIKGARPFTIEQSKDGSDSPKFTKRVVSKGLFTFHKDEDQLAANKTRLATRSIGNGALTTCTSVYYLPANKGRYVIYFTFDGDSIEDAKVLCCDVSKDKDYDNKYYVKEIPQWKSVRPEEYRK